MVDRIVPATKPEDIARLAALTGVLDLSPVMHEPFRQWVVEDDFVDGARPDLGAVGVQLVEDVTPFELMKLRMLNGTHSSLAYLGYLAGHETIADTVADPAFAGFVPPPLARRDHPDASRRRRARISAPTPRRSSSATPTRRSATAPGRSPWTAARSCRSASSAPSPTTAPPGAPCPGLDPRRRRLDALCRRRGREAARPIDVRDPLADAAEGALATRARDAGRQGRGAPRGRARSSRRRSPPTAGFRDGPRRPRRRPLAAEGARAAVARFGA